MLDRSGRRSSSASDDLLDMLQEESAPLVILTNRQRFVSLDGNNFFRNVMHYKNGFLLVY